MYGPRPPKRQRRIKPIARVGAVDIAVRYDIANAGQDRGNEEANVCEGELVYSVVGGSAPYRDDNSLHVLSHVGLAKVPTKDKIFQGVAVTPFNAKSDVYQQGFVIQVAGMCSIFNNSGKNINAGDDVFVNLDGTNTHVPGGVPYKKKLIQLVSVPDITTVGEEAPVIAGLTFIGVCVKGGRPGCTIDVVLQRN